MIHIPDRARTYRIKPNCRHLRNRYLPALILVCPYDYTHVVEWLNRKILLGKPFQILFAHESKKQKKPAAQTPQTIRFRKVRMLYVLISLYASFRLLTSLLLLYELLLFFSLLLFNFYFMFFLYVSHRVQVAITTKIGLAKKIWCGQIVKCSISSVHAPACTYTEEKRLTTRINNVFFLS